MIKLYWLVGIATLSLMSYAQYAGWDVYAESPMAENTSAQYARSGHGTSFGSLRTFHK